MSFYNEHGERVTPIFENGVLISDNPEYINFIGNVAVTQDGMGGVIVNVLGVSAAGKEYGSGLVNGINKIFTFTHAPAIISLDGQILSNLSYGLQPADYTISGINQITLLNAPLNTPPLNNY